MKVGLFVLSFVLEEEIIEPTVALVCHLLFRDNLFRHFFLCHFHRADLAYALGVDTHSEKMALKHSVEDEGGKLPAEHGHGTEYNAPEDTKKRWMSMDPLNVMNPGVGGLSSFEKYAQN